MIAGGWPYIWAAYAVTLLCLGALALGIVLHLRLWARRARALDQVKPNSGPFPSIPTDRVME